MQNVLQISVSDALHFYRSVEWTSFQILTHMILNQSQHLQTRVSWRWRAHTAICKEQKLVKN